MTTTSARIWQWIGIILIAGLIGAAYWYFNVRANTLNQSQNDSNTSSLVGMWSFNGDDMSETTATDRSGQGNNGTLTNSPQITEGRVGQALNFFPNGSDSNAYVTMGDPVSGALDFGSGDFSVGFWMKGRGFNVQSSSINALVCKKNQNSANSPGYCFYYTNTNLLTFIIGNSTSDFTATQTVSTTSDNLWHYYVGVRSGGASTLYVDGVAVATNTSVSGSVSTTDSFTVGSSSTDPNGRNANADIDEVRVYNAALSATQIQSLYAMGSPDKVNSSISQPQGTGRLDSGLAGYWKLDDGSGASASDSSTNGNNGTLTNSPTWTTGLIGGAVDFDGTDDCVLVSDANSLDITGEVTLSAWIRKDTNLSAGGRSTILTKGTFGGPAVNYYLGTYGSGSGERLEFSFYGSSATQRLHGSTNIATGTWYFVSAVYNDTSNSITLYVNGVKETNTVLSGDPVNAVMIANAQNIEIGRYNGNTQFFDGSLDEIRLYNRALSSDEVAQLYRLTTPTGVDTGLKGYWSFNGKDTTSTTAYDRSGAGNTGTLTNGPTIAEGKIGQALSFDGTDDYVDAGSGSALDDLSVVTVSAWIKQSSNKAFAPITLKGSNVTPISAGWVFITDGGGTNARTLGFRASFGTTDLVVVSSTNVYALNDWYHVVATWDQSTTAANVHLYVNGVEVGYATQTNGVGAYDSDAAQSLWIGRGGNIYFPGLIDEPRVYNRVLSAAEVASLYNSSR